MSRRQSKIKLANAKYLQLLPALVVVLAIAALGLKLLLGSHAATPLASSAEAESGTRSGTTSLVSDTAGSGSSAVQFGTKAVANRTLNLMPLGDSITLGQLTGVSDFTLNGGYRTLLWQKLVQQDGDKINFVGTQSNGPSTLGDKDHEGHSGWRIDDIRNSIDSWMAANPPDIVLLHIGTNDIVQQYNLSTAPARLQDLISRICTDKPGVHIIVAAIIVRPGLDSYVNAYNAAIPGIVTSEQNSGCQASYINMNPVLTGSDLGSDSTHPLPEGYDKMANVWYPAVTTLYHTLEGN